MHKTLILFCTIVSIISVGNLVNAQTNVFVVPIGSDAPTEKTIFITTTSFQGNLDGVAGADDKCQTEANNAVPPLPGIYKAWISRTGTPSIPSRPSFRKHDLPYKNVDDSLVASSFDDFLDGNFPGTIKTIEGSSNFRQAWTGTQNDGTDGNLNCLNWTSNDEGDRGMIGVNIGGPVTSDWSSDGSSICSSARHLYCFEQ